MALIGVASLCLLNTLHDVHLIQYSQTFHFLKCFLIEYTSLHTTSVATYLVPQYCVHLVTLTLSCAHILFRAQVSGMEEAKKQLQSEVVSVKTRWSDEVKLIKAPSTSPTAPLPLAVLRNIPRPAAAAAFDLEALALKLWVTTLATADRREAVRVEVPSGTVPDALAHAIAHRLDELWKKKLAKGGERAGWMLESEISLQPPFSPHLSHSAPHVTR